MLGAGYVNVNVRESVADYDYGDDLVIKGWGSSGEEVPSSRGGFRRCLVGKR